jgi:2-amino-4-hydroxy-6-hydroxymethyldihydropteridine diphosphokinase
LDSSIASLGQQWYEVFYDRISSTLGYSKSADEKTRDDLSVLLLSRNIRSIDKQFAELQNQVRGKKIIMFGAGPSLREDVMKLYPVARKKKNIVVAADGATDALLDAMIIPRFSVSDLDSCSFQALKDQSEKRYLFVHGHADNVGTIRATVPKLGRNIIGTTQVESSENVLNFGGLTDGDRACYIASTLDPEAIVIAGMDFGKEEGEYSKSRTTKSITTKESSSTYREKKLRFGKESLEFLIQVRNKIRFVNATSHGDHITGAETQPLLKVIEELS